MTRVRISGAAEADLLDGFTFYESQQDGLGAYFLDALSADIEALQLFAGIHPKPIGRFHRTLAKRFPFAIATTSMAKQPPWWQCSTAGKIRPRSRRA